MDAENEAFVSRPAVMGEIERQVMLSTGCPGLILYGRRRTGKSTVLRNLRRFLPASVVSVGISMQNPGMFTTLGDWMAKSCEAIGMGLHGRVASGHDPAICPGSMPGSADTTRTWRKTSGV